MGSGEASPGVTVDETAAMAVGAVFSLSSSLTGSCFTVPAAINAAFLLSALLCLLSLLSFPRSQWMAMGSVKGLEAERRRLLAGDGVVLLAALFTVGCGCC